MHMIAASCASQQITANFRSIRQAMAFARTLVPTLMPAAIRAILPEASKQFRGCQRMYNTRMGLVVLLFKFLNTKLLPYELW